MNPAAVDVHKEYEGFGITPLHQWVRNSIKARQRHGTMTAPVVMDPDREGVKP